MKIFNLKILSVCVGVAALGLGTISLMDNPKNTYPEYHKLDNSKSKLQTTANKDAGDFHAMVNSECTSETCSIGVESGVSKGKLINDFSMVSKTAQPQLAGSQSVSAESTVTKSNVKNDAISLSYSETKTDTGSTEHKTAESIEPKFVTAVVRSSDTIISVCNRLGVDADDVSSMIYGSGIGESKFDLRVGQRVDVQLNDKHELLEMRIHNKGGFTYKSFKKVGDEYKFNEKDYPHSQEELVKEFKYGGSFLKNAEAIGLTKSESRQLFDKLNDRVNFNNLSRDAVIKFDISQTVINGTVSKFTINAAQIESPKYNLTAVNLNGNLYDSKGNSLSPSFLRHPLAGKVRVTSHFSLNRMHPILHYRRPHWGTDYGCPIGTPILSISDAKVIRAGRVRGFGNMVMLKHPHHIETIAAHMIRIAKGIHVGSRVKKGQVIGYVGKTGLSTGPHLHFEMRINGKRVDSLKAKLPVMANVSQDSGFKLQMKNYVEKFSNM